MQNLTEAHREKLLASLDYRVFIKAVIAARSRPDKNFGFSDIARLGDFSARSFPREVANGIRRITPSSLPKFSAGLALVGDWAEYFRLLVQLAEADCRTEIKEDEQLRLLISQLASKLKNAPGGLDGVDDSGPA